MNKEESDFRNMIAVFDAALSSDDPQVKQALNTLVMMVALTRDPDGSIDGPFHGMLNAFNNNRRQMDDLQHQIEKLQRELDLLKTYPADGRHSWKPWGNDIRGTSVDQIWIDEASIVPGAAWESFIKKKVTK
jgi:hypothetical protein